MTEIQTLLTAVCLLYIVFAFRRGVIMDDRPYRAAINWTERQMRKLWKDN